MITITGTGAVTPAGWGVAEMMRALDEGVRIEPGELVRERGDAAAMVTPVLRVPPVAATSALPKSPRLRRVSPVSKFAVGAAVEALASDTDGKLRGAGVGLLVVSPE